MTCATLRRIKSKHKLQDSELVFHVFLQDREVALRGPTFVCMGSKRFEKCRSSIEVSKQFFLRNHQLLDAFGFVICHHSFRL